jgi:hypothetical protein
MRQYSKEEFIRITLELLHDNPLAEYIAEQVYTREHPNIRDCVRIAALAATEQDVLRILRVRG